MSHQSKWYSVAIAKISPSTNSPILRPSTHQSINRRIPPVISTLLPGVSILTPTQEATTSTCTALSPSDIFSVLQVIPRLLGVSCIDLAFKTWALRLAIRVENHLRWYQRMERRSDKKNWRNDVRKCLGTGWDAGREIPTEAYGLVISSFKTTSTTSCYSL